MTLILASESATRVKLLAQVGVDFTTRPARVDERAIKDSLIAEGASVEDIVDTLAEYKAKRVAQSESGFVLGCDQILVHNKELLSKAENIEQARLQLQRLRGEAHVLLSAAVIYEDHKPVWRKIGRAQLFMADFSDATLDAYLERHGADTVSYTHLTLPTIA